MTRQIQEADLQAIEEVALRQPEGMTAQQINDALESSPPLRTLQYRIKSLVTSKRLVMVGVGRATRYRVPTNYRVAVNPASFGFSAPSVQAQFLPPLSEAGSDIREYVCQPPEARKPVGYNRSFLDSYRPNHTFYLSQTQRRELREAGKSNSTEQPAGTHAKQILNRLMIDLSWNSSRLEGNTYSLLDTEVLIEVGKEAEGRGQSETQMILNHKGAIEFLIESAEDIGFNRYTLLNLHALLADNLLLNPDAVGRLRRLPVEVYGSEFHPLVIPQLIEECFDQILTTASAIRDPFEQAFFVLLQLPYLQPFDDVNKRVSRLAANIPLIRANLSPLSFEDVSRELYTEAVIGVYELNRHELLRDLFTWAYKRSAARYVAIRQSLGEPDPFRMRYRTELLEVVGTVVRGRMDKIQATQYLASWSRERVDPEVREQFQAVSERALLGLHEGNIAPYRIKPSEFADWLAIWSANANLAQV